MADGMPGGPLAKFGPHSIESAPEMPVMGDVMRPIQPADDHARCELILERFLNDDALYAVPVVDGSGKPIALLDRRRFVEFFSHRYRREIFGQRKVSELMAHERYRNLAPIIVPDSCSIVDAAKIIVDADPEHMVTGIIISSAGKYAGLANGHDLINIMTKRRQEELYYLAHFDSLTGVPNRVLFWDRLQHACREAHRRKTQVGVLFVDVDDFKDINDSLGHAEGDAVLREIVRRFSAAAREADTVARLAGDEFAVLVADLQNPDDMDRLVARLMEATREPIGLSSGPRQVRVSVGGAIFPTDDTDVSRLLAKADAAMYEAKNSGGDGYRRFGSGAGGAP